MRCPVDRTLMIVDYSQEAQETRAHSLDIGMCRVSIRPGTPLTE
jgi:hypothetical protein